MSTSLSDILKLKMLKGTKSGIIYENTTIDISEGVVFLAVYKFVNNYIHIPNFVDYFRSGIKFIDCHYDTVIVDGGDNLKQICDLYLKKTKKLIFKSRLPLLEDIDYTFSRCTELQYLDLRGLSGICVQSIQGLCQPLNHITNIEYVDMSGLDLSNCESFASAFEDCEKLKGVNLSNIKTSKLQLTQDMFRGCKSLKTVDLSSIDFSKVTNMSRMFKYCSKLEKIDLSFATMFNLKVCMAMFKGCKNLIDCKLFRDKTDSTKNWLFQNCTSLREIDISMLDSAHGKLFTGCTNLEKVVFGGINLTCIYDFDSYFSDCTNLMYLDLTGTTVNKLASDYNGKISYRTVLNKKIGKYIILKKLVYKGKTVGTRVLLSKCYKEFIYDCAIVVDNYSKFSSVNLKKDGDSLCEEYEYKNNCYIEEITKEKFFELLGVLSDVVHEV